ncbi:CBS domain-containing protein [Desulfofalx alkaliphila]|uniref:CBS domain-containing protein n=1 Tax=Desulfofalx alkaliphila TaxID=105483 RepID=UPI0004E1143F|nr:CBS domain-containing protein [Desulfofalx alkaliphila]
MNVKDIMSTNVVTVNEDTTIENLAKLLIENQISGVPVVNEGHRLVGIVTEGDLLHKEIPPRRPEYVGILGGIIYKGLKTYKEDFKKLAAIKASEIMTKRVVTTTKDSPVEEAASLMVKHKVKRLPVVEGDKIVGIVSRSDIIKNLTE